MIQPQIIEIVPKELLQYMLSEFPSIALVDQVNQRESVGESYGDTTWVILAKILAQHM